MMHISAKPSILGPYTLKIKLKISHQKRKGGLKKWLQGETVGLKYIFMEINCCNHFGTPFVGSVLYKPYLLWNSLFAGTLVYKVWFADQ